MEDEEKTSPKKYTDCICPRCEIEHRMRLYWSGKLPAKKFCWWCNKIVNEQGARISSVNLIISGRDIDFHMSKKEGT